MVIRPADPYFAPLADTAFDPCSPVIIVGAGRSGSTLLVRLLNSHPDISFRGETKFLLAELWDTLWKNPDWYRFPEYVATQPHSSDECDRAGADRKLGAAREWAGTLFARLMAGLLRADPLRRIWGFKEIWNGAGSFQVPWDCYDHVFAGATWVHLVRHPLDYLGSSLAWNGSDITLPSLQLSLAEWVAIVRRSRARAATGRFFEVRYEDLKAAARPTLRPLFDRLGIEWDDACAEALTKKVLDSRRDTFAERHFFPLLERTPELLELAAAYDYSL